MNRVVLSIGANLGDKYVNCEKAVSYISSKIGYIISKSDTYESEAWGFNSVDNFINSVVIVDTHLSADSLIKVIWDIELMFGKERGSMLDIVDSYANRKEDYANNTPTSYSSRFMDIDIIYYNSDILSSDILDIPHKLISERSFVLIPLCDVAPDFIHPILKISSLDMLSRLHDSD